MEENDEYKRYAADARYMAERAVNPQDQAAWLEIADGWLELIDRRARRFGLGGTPDRGHDMLH